LTASASIIVSAGTRWQWAASIRGLLVDRGVDERDEGLEQHLELVDEVPVGERYGGLGGERFRETLVGRSERPAPVGARLLTVDQLQHADDFAFVVLQSAR